MHLLLWWSCSKQACEPCAQGVYATSATAPFPPLFQLPSTYSATVFTSVSSTRLWGPARQHHFLLPFLQHLAQHLLLDKCLNEWNNLMTKEYETFNFYLSCWQFASFHSWPWGFLFCCCGCYFYSWSFSLSSSLVPIMATSHSLSASCQALC